MREFLAPRGRVHAYRLKQSSFFVLLRHRTQDLGTLHEVFVSHHYIMPAEAAEAIRDGSALEISDLGANIGLFGVHALINFPDARLTAFEPDDANARLLSRCVELNAAADRWRIRGECVSNARGTVKFAAGDLANSRVSRGGTATVEQVDFFEVTRSSDLIKIDIEGSEWPILRDTRLRDVKARAIVLEWHAVGDTDTSARTALECLRNSGFEATSTVSDSTVGMIWAWRASTRDGDGAG